jgi:hypothetical protein
MNVCCDHRSAVGPKGQGNGATYATGRSRDDDFFSCQIHNGLSFPKAIGPYQLMKLKIRRYRTVANSDT